MQLTLFASDPSPVEEALEAIDPDGLTPIEAIQKLYELRALLAARARP
jgi:DNA mismatch repair protein MutS